MITTTQTSDLRDLALGYVAGGLSLVPCDHRTKRPEPSLLPRDDNGKPTWKPYQQAPASAQVVRCWFPRCKTVAVVCGAVSGGLLIIDFDVDGFYERWKEAVGELADGLPVQRTGGSGYHVALRCPTPGHNDKLAWAPDETQETGRAIAVETRGEGGYAVLPGSLHPGGRLYETVAGDWSAVPTVSQAHADALLGAARKLDEAPLTRQQIEAKAKESTTHRASSNGQASVIDAYNDRFSIAETLDHYGYTAIGDRYARPGSDGPSVAVKDGRSFHHSTNDLMSDGFWHRPFDLFCQYDHGGECRSAVKAAADLLGLKDTTTVKPRQAATADELAELGIDDHVEEDAGGRLVTSDSGGARDTGDKKDRFPLVSCATLDSEDYRVRAIIDGMLYADSPGLDGAMFKTCKTLFAIDGAISVASGCPFLGVFQVPEPLSVVYFSGEGGPSIAQDYGRRVAASKDLRLADVSNLHWCFTVPRLESLPDLDAVCRIHDETAAELMVFDNLMLCLSGDEAGNVMKQGQILGNVIRICGERGITPLFVHHFKRSRANADPFAPGELSDLTQAGPAEIAGQWWLITRRERYDPDQPGEHRLWFTAGGRVGHSSLHAIDIHEGRRSDPDGRRWKVEVFSPSEVADVQRDARESQRAEKARQQLDDDRKAIIDALARLREPDSKNSIRDLTGIGHKGFDRAWGSLLQDRTIERSGDIRKGNKQTYPAFKLATEKVQS